MGFLADVGRSNAFEVGQQVFKDTLAVGQQERQGLLGELQARDQMERTAIFQAEEERRKQETNIKLQADEKTRNWLASPFNIKSSPLLPPPDDETYQEKFGKLRAMAGANELGITTNEGMLNAAKLMKDTPEALKEWYKPRLDKIENAINDTDEKIFNADAAGKTDLVKELKAKRGRLHAMLLQKSGQYDKWLLEKEKIQGREDTAQIRADASIEASRIRADASAEAARIRAEAKGTSADSSKDSSRRAKIHGQVKELFGLSDFVQNAKDAELRPHYLEVAAFSDEVSRNPVGYGLNKNAGEAEIAERAYNIWKKMKGAGGAGESRPPIGSFGGKK